MDKDSLIAFTAYLYEIAYIDLKTFHKYWEKFIKKAEDKKKNGIKGI